MENNQMKQTKFDSMVTNQTMQLVKAVIPYINSKFSTYIGMYIKFLELQNAMHLQSSVYTMASTENHDMESLLDDLNDFLSDDIRGNIDMIKMMMEMMNSSDSTGNDFMNSFMNMGGFSDMDSSQFMNSFMNGDDSVDSQKENDKDNEESVDINDSDN